MAEVNHTLRHFLFALDQLSTPGEAVLELVIAANGVSRPFVYTVFGIRYTLISETLSSLRVAGINTRRLC